MLKITSIQPGYSVWDGSNTDFSQYWTIFLLEPSPAGPGKFGNLFKPPLDDFQETEAFSTSRLQTAMLYLILKILKQAVEDWDIVLTTFKEDLDTTDTFLHSDSLSYEKILWDDDNWSNSKKYAWYINALSTLERTVEGNRMDYYQYRKDSLQPLIQMYRDPVSESGHSQQGEGNPIMEMEVIAGYMKQADTLCDKLKDQEKEFINLRSGVTALRDGVSWRLGR